ncbi:MAG: hypothetical protein WBD55_01100 [Dehalococcoidia bacterium]
MDATLTVEEIGPATRRIVVDCEHGKTTGLVCDGAALGDIALVEVAIASHYAEEEGCACTFELTGPWAEKLRAEADERGIEDEHIARVRYA